MSSDRTPSPFPGRTAPLHPPATLDLRTYVRKRSLWQRIKALFRRHT